MWQPLRLVCLSLCSVLCVACAPQVGDSCQSALDCSTNNTRLCDRTQPGGYCTLEGCEKGTCPSEAICVKFNPLVERLSVAYCMYECEDDGDCRKSEGYQCTSSDEFGTDTRLEALVLDGTFRKFCSIPASNPDAILDAGPPLMSMADAAPATDDDAGAPTSSDDAGSSP